MRGTVNLISRTIALIVVFAIGFATLAGFMVGGGYLAFTKISIDVLQELGFEIKVDDQFDLDAAEVDLTALTLQQMVDEFVMLSELSDTVSIQYLTDRYGLTATSKLPSFVSQKYKDMPIKQLFTEETKDEFLNTTLVGDIYGYTKTVNLDYDAELDEGNPYVWTDKSGVELVGLSALMASYTIGEILSISSDPSVLTNDLAIAEILELKCMSGLPVYIKGTNVAIDSSELSKPIKVWIDSDGNVVNGVIASIAPYKIGEVETAMDSMTIGDITSHVLYRDQWYLWTYDIEGCIILEPKDDVTTELADVTIASVSNGGLSDEVKDVKLSSVLGYTQGEDGKWYNDKPEQITGIMAAIAPYKVGELDTKVGKITMGEISGYTYDEESGLWLDDDLNEATGILGALADLTVDEMSEESKLSAKVQTISVADIMGYTWSVEDGKWYTSGNEAVTGIMGVIADSPINQASDKIDNSKMADIFGFTTKTSPDGYPVLDSNGNVVYFDEEGNDVHVLMQKIARTDFKDVDTLAEDIRLSDLFSEDDLSTGYLSFLKASNPTLDELPAAVDSVLQETSIGELAAAGVFGFSEDEIEMVQNSDLANMNVPEFILSTLTPIP